MSISRHRSSSTSGWEHEISARLDALEKIAAAAISEGNIDILKTKLCEVLDAIVHDVSDVLAQTENDTPYKEELPKGELPKGELSARQLSAASRHRQSTKRFCDEMAYQLVIGTLLNYNNPTWDPSDPSTHRPDMQSNLVKLLQLGCNG